MQLAKLYPENMQTPILKDVIQGNKFIHASFT